MIHTYYFRKIENSSASQQTYIIDNITETYNQTISHIDNYDWNNDKTATVILNPTPTIRNCQLFTMII